MSVWSWLWASPGALLLVQVTLVLAAGSAVALVLRRRSAATRSMWWLLVVATLLALPAVDRMAPDLPLLPALGSPEARRSALPVEMLEESEASSRPALEAADGARAPSVDDGPGFDRTSASAPGPIGGRALALWLWLVWGAGATIVLARQIAAVRSASRLVRDAHSVDDPGVLREVGVAARAVGLSRTPRVRVSGEVGVPSTWGVLRPVIVLPEAYAGWSASQLRSVLLHECSHVVRWDVPARIVSMLACALYWLHPGVWYAQRRLRETGERACDDRVLLTGVAPDRYAGHLLSIARCARPRPSPVVSTMARSSELEARMRHVLSSARRRPAPSRSVRVGSVMGCILVGGVVASAAPARSPQTLSDPTRTAGAAGVDVAAAPLREDAFIRGPRIVDWALPSGGRAVAVVRGDVAIRDGGTRVVPLDASSSIAVKWYDASDDLRALYIVQLREGRVREGLGRPLPTGGEVGLVDGDRARLRSQILPGLGAAARETSPLTVGTVSDYGDEGEPGRWSEIFPEHVDHDFVTRATARLGDALPDADVEALREAAMEVWAHLNQWILWPGTLEDGHPRMTIYGHSHMTLLHGDVPTPMVDVSTRAGPLEVVLPAVVRRRLENAGASAPALGAQEVDALQRVGAELASYWERVITEGEGE